MPPHYLVKRRCSKLLHNTGIYYNWTASPAFLVSERSTWRHCLYTIADGFPASSKRLPVQDLRVQEVLSSWYCHLPTKVTQLIPASGPCSSIMTVTLRPLYNCDDRLFDVSYRSYLTMCSRLGAVPVVLTCRYDIRINVAYNRCPEAHTPRATILLSLYTVHRITVGCYSAMVVQTTVLLLIIVD